VKLLLDVHIAVAVAKGLARKCPGLLVEHLRDWQEGRQLAAPDADILQTAMAGGWTLVTYDLATIPSLLRQLAEERKHHAGVILIDDKTISSHNVGALVSALAELVSELGELDWTDRTQFLRRAKRAD